MGKNNSGWKMLTAFLAGVSSVLVVKELLKQPKVKRVIKEAKKGVKEVDHQVRDALNAEKLAQAKQEVASKIAALKEALFKAVDVDKETEQKTTAKNGTKAKKTGQVQKGKKSSQK